MLSSILQAQQEDPNISEINQTIFQVEEEVNGLIDELTEMCE